MWDALDDESSLRVPDVDQGVIACRNQPVTLRQVYARIHDSLVPTKNVDGHMEVGPPHHDYAIVGARGKHETALVPRDTQHMVLMPCNTSDTATRPTFDRSVSVGAHMVIC